MSEDRAYFTKEMKKTHTILVPTMLPIHFGIFARMLEQEGYHVKVLTNTGHEVVEEGLANVHNDMCYPALLAIGQLIDGVKNSGIPRDRVAVMITQTGGGCRASNYLYLLSKALKKSGYGDIPVISASFTNDKHTEGFRLSIPFLLKAAYAAFVADLIMLLGNQCKPYEINPGETKELEEELTKQTADFFYHMKVLSWKKTEALMREIVQRFREIPRRKEKKTKVGIVGEIYVKYSPLGNNNLEDFLLSEGCEVVCPGFLDFALYCVYNGVEDYNFYGMGKMGAKVKNWILKKADELEDRTNAIITENSDFTPMGKFSKLPELVKDHISTGMKMGEGWLLTAEMADLIESGVNNVICTQPFGCLPNHIVGKGMMRSMKSKYPDANIAAIDYDPGASQVNQQNRIKLMLENARALEREKEAAQNGPAAADPDSAEAAAI